MQPWELAFIYLLPSLTGFCQEERSKEIEAESSWSQKCRIPARQYETFNANFVVSDSMLFTSSIRPLALVAPHCYINLIWHFYSLRLIPLWTSPETQTDYSQNGENFAGKWKITRSDEWLFSKKMINLYFDNFYETISLANPISREPHESFSFGFVSLAFSDQNCENSSNSEWWEG